MGSPLPSHSGQGPVGVGGRGTRLVHMCMSDVILRLVFLRVPIPK